MEASILLFPVEEKWWVWQGSRNDYRYGMHGWRDAMDQDDFDEAKSFPSRKPNFDAFGIPRYSRKQRGWYQVKRWPTACHASTTLATAADLPSELLARIINDLSSLLRWTTLDRDDRGTLSSCSSVCRYWEEKCRPVLFKTLSLRSRQDVLVFRDFNRDPSCLFFPLLEEIILLVQKLSECPWVYIFSQTRYEHEYALSLEGPVPAGWRTIRSIHQGLPQALPPIFSRGIKALTLTDIHFLLLNNLVQLIGELPQLKKLHCKKVTWGSLSTVMTRRHRQASRGQLEPISIRMSAPSETWARASIFLLPGFRGCGAPCFAPDGLPTILALVEILEILAMPMTEDMSFGIDVHENTAPLDLGSVIIDVSIFAEGWISSMFKLSLKCRRYSAQVEEISRLSHVSVVSVELRRRNGSWVPLDWSKFEAAVCSFSFLDIVILGFASRNDMLCFIEEFVDAQRMPLLSARNLLRYAVVEPDDTPKWYQAYPQSQIVESRCAKPTYRYLADVYDNYAMSTCLIS